MQLHADEGCINKTSSAWMLNEKYQQPVVVANAFPIFSIANLSICSVLGTSSNWKKNKQNFLV